MNDTKKILIAEDDEFLIKAYKAKFEDAGFELLMAADGEEALNLIRSEKPNIVLLDIMMPKNSGFEVLEQVRQDPGMKDLPIIITSNLGQEGDIDKGMEKGATDYMVKTSFTMDEMMEKINKYL